jgi:hypothetical protein
MLAGVFSVPRAQATNVICDTGNPLQSLAGTWAFMTEGFQFPPTAFLGSAGRFVATVGTDKAGGPLGLLSITQTASIDGSTVRLETDAGRYQVHGDCSRGTLIFNVSSRPAQFDFFFVNRNVLYYVGSNNGDIIRGIARRVGAGFENPSCPAQPLQALAGTWVFTTHGFSFPPTVFLASAGRFEATVGTNRNGDPTGVLTITQTASIGGGPARLEVDSGRYQLRGNCSGGTLIFNVSSRPVIFDFFFVNENTIFLAGSNNGDIVTGTAQRAGTGL